MAGTLREYRRSHKWSQQDLADRLDATKGTIQRWERGDNVPGPFFRGKLCALFNVSEAELFGSAATPLPQESTHAPPATLHDPAIPLIPLHNFVGRLRERSTIKARLRAGSSVLLTTVEGIPGVGKTTLAIAMAHDPEIRAYFQDGILWAGLGPQPNILSILSRWGALLNVSVPSTETNINTWRHAIRHAVGLRNMLLVIDDVWDAAHATALQVGGANCRYLVTSRFPSESNFLAPDGVVHLKELSPPESLHLLRQLAPIAVEKEPDKVLQLIQAIGGLPLALTLFGNYLRKHSYTGQDRRINAALDSLQDRDTRLSLGEIRAPIEAHPSLEAPYVSLHEIIAASSRHLPEASNHALYALSVLPAKPYSFSEQAALSIAACSPEAFDALLDAGVVTFLSSEAESRYTLHQTIHDYASAQLETLPAREEVYVRLIDYVLAFVQQALDQDKFERENALVLAALDAALNFHSEKLPPLLLRTIPYFFRSGAYTLLEPYLQTAVEHTHDPQDRLNLTLHLARSLQAQAKFVQEKELLLSGLEQAQQIASSTLEIQFLTNLGGLLPKMEQPGDAVVLLKRGLELASNNEDLRIRFYLYKYLGSAYDRLGRFSEGAGCYQQSFSLAQQLQDKELLCSCLVNQGVSAATQGFDREAEEHWQLALALARDIGLVELLAIVLVNLAELYNQWEALPLAHQYLQECLVLAESLNLKEWRAVASLIRGSVYRKQGAYEQALSSLQISLTSGRELAPGGKHRIIAQSYLEMGEVALAQGDLARAEQLLQAGRAGTPPSDPESEALAYYYSAQLALAKGNCDEARRYGELSLQLFERIGHGWTQKVAAWLKSLEPASQTS